MMKHKQAESFFKYLNDMGQESYKTVHTALEAIGSGDELDIAAFRSDDFLGKVLDKFGWLLKYQPPDTKNKDKTVYATSSTNIIINYHHHHHHQQHHYYDCYYYCHWDYYYY